MTSKVCSQDGTTIAYDRVGNGPVVILVDGALCHRRFGPSGDLAKALSPHFSVVTYDRRGRGDSGQGTAWTAEREVEDLQALIAAVGGSASVCGISSGAALALEAANRGVAITKLALYAPSNRCMSRRTDLTVPADRSQAGSAGRTR